MRTTTKWIATATLALALLALGSAARAQTPTAEGTVITNTAHATWTDANSNTYTEATASVSVTVGFQAGVDVTTATATVTPGAPSSSNEVTLSIKNGGNGADSMSVAMSIPAGLTVTGRTLGENLEGAQVFDEDVIVPLERPIGPEGGVAVLRGNLAPNGAVIKHTAAEPRLLQHAGPAVVFKNYADLEARIEYDDSTVSFGGRLTRVESFPISIAWPDGSASKPLEACRTAVRARLGVPPDQLVGLGLDRLDYTKGIVERLLAVERLFELHPEWIGRFTFIQIAAPSRSSLDEYQRFEAQVRSTAAQVNARFGEPGASVVQRPLSVFHHRIGVIAAHLRYRIGRQLSAKWGRCCELPPGHGGEATGVRPGHDHSNGCFRGPSACW